MTRCFQSLLRLFSSSSALMPLSYTVSRIPLVREPPVGAAGAFAVRFVVEGAAFFAEFVAHFSYISFTMILTPSMAVILTLAPFCMKPPSLTISSLLPEKSPVPTGLRAVTHSPSSPMSA